MRTAGTEGGRARDDVAGENVELGLAGFSQRVQFGAEAAVAQLGGDFFGGFD